MADADHRHPLERLDDELADELDRLRSAPPERHQVGRVSSLEAMLSPSAIARHPIHHGLDAIASAVTRRHGDLIGTLRAHMGEPDGDGTPEHTFALMFGVLGASCTLLDRLAKAEGVPPEAIIRQYRDALDARDDAD